MKKRWLSLALCFVIVAALLVALVSCDDDEGDKAKYNYDITVWVGENTKTLTEQLIAAFNANNEFDVKFNATVEIVSESKAVGDASSKPADCADIFTFAQDQLARAVKLNLLAPLNSSSVQNVIDNNDADSVEATKVGDTIRAFPMTADNGYFMYYDKRVISEEHIGSLEDILADCKAAGKNFSMSLATVGSGSWYAASFFYATGCVSEWTTDANGSFTNYNDTFKGAAGREALYGMQKILQSGSHNDSDKVSDFDAGIASAAVVSGIWDYNAAKEKLGSNLGIAPLPAFTGSDGVTKYQLVTYLGHKMMGIKPQSDSTKLLLLQKLAMYLTSAESQLKRFEQVGWGPCNKVAAANEAVLASSALSVFKTTFGDKTYCISQGQYPANWWTEIEAMALSVKTSQSDEASLNIILNKYQSSLGGLLG